MSIFDWFKFRTPEQHIKIIEKYLNDNPIKRSRREVLNVATTLLKTDYLVAYTTLTATRAITLPAAATVAGQFFIIKDEAGTAGTNNLTIVGVVNGATNPTAVSANYGFYKIYSNGTAYFTY